jgi:hypothetical protein
MGGGGGDFFFLRLRWTGHLREHARHVWFSSCSLSLSISLYVYLRFRSLLCGSSGAVRGHVCGLVSAAACLALVLEALL